MRRARELFASAALSAFGLTREPFRVERYAFAIRPHAGPLLYEHYDWGLSGEEWVQLAGDALLGARIR